MNRKRNLGSAVALALVGTLLLVSYVRAAEGRATAGQRMVPVVVVTDDIDEGTAGKKLLDRLRIEHVPAGARADGALRSFAPIGDRVPLTDLYAGEQLVAERIGSAQDLPTEVPPGRTLVSVSLEAQRALGGQARAGSEVDVLVSYDDPARTETVLRDVPVISVVENDAPSGPAGEIAKLAATVDGNVLVTLSVPDADAERLVYAADHGRLWLAGAEGVEVAR